MTKATTKSDINKERMKDCDLGFYFCLVENSFNIGDTLEVSRKIEVRELEWSDCSEMKYFAPCRGGEIIVNFKKILDKPPSEWEESVKSLTGNVSSFLNAYFRIKK